jgi:hypothetical protein
MYRRRTECNIQNYLVEGVNLRSSIGKNRCVSLVYKKKHTDCLFKPYSSNVQLNSTGTVPDCTRSNVELKSTRYVTVFYVACP